RLRRLIAVERKGQRKRPSSLAGWNEDHIEHPAAVPLMERQAARQDQRLEPARADFEILRSNGASVRGHAADSAIAAQERRPFVAPGEPGAEIGVPRIALR